MKFDIHASQTALRHNIRTQWLMLAVAVTILTGVIGYQTFTSYRDITNQEQLRLQTQATVVSANIERQLEATDLTLNSVIHDIAYLRSHDKIKLTNRRLNALTEAMPGIRSMLILDKNGTVTASNRENFIGKDFSSRDYYQVPFHQQDLSNLYVSPPFKSILGPTILNLSRIIPASDGSFSGVTVAALDPDYFGSLLDSVRYAPDMTCAITHGDGLRFMLIPDKAGLAGKNQNVPGSFFARHRASTKEQNIFNGRSVSTGEENMMAVQTVNPKALRLNKPLYVFVSRQTDRIYAGWHRQLRISALFLVMLCTAMMLGLHLLQRRQKRLELQAHQTQGVMELRLNLMEYSLTHDLQELLKEALDEVCSLSDSPIGFYHFVKPDQQTLSLQAWSTRTLNEFCVTEGHGLHYPVEKAGVWADCVRQKRPIVHNNYATLPDRKGLPEGHAPVIRELVVPIFRAGLVVAILGIGNKETDYTEHDVELATYLADIAWEITERKQNEEERHKLNIRYQTLQSIARDGIHILDMDGNLVESNAAFRQMLGYAAEENLTLNLTEWDAAIPREELVTTLRELILSPATFETRHRRCDGTLFDAEVSACGVQLGGEWYLYASSRDVSKRKEMEDTLRESRQRQADIFDFLPDATFVVDLDKKVIAWNRAMEEMSGVSKEEILGQGDHAYTIPFYGDRRNQLLDLIDVEDEELKAKYQGVTRIGDRLFGETFCPALFNGKGAHVWAIVAPLYDSDGTRIGAIESIRNITAIKETETNLARSNRELEQFAYVASHDLQEPLRKIAGFTELLASRYKDTFDEKAESYMAYIIDGATRMRSLINDLLSYSRVMSSAKELAETDCSTVLSRVLRDLDMVIKESNTEIVCGPLPVIHADQSQLGQLFQNLIGNAIKYRGAAAPMITINAVRQSNDWLFSVADNGLGIAPEFHERIFAIFQRLHTRSEYPGTGIGLAVCNKIVERHGGKIWVESTGNAGSTFFFTIPLTPNDVENR